jgi:integrase
MPGPPSHRLIVTTILFSGMRISEALGLVWADVDFAQGVIRVQAQLSVPRAGEPGRRVKTKTPASVREIPLIDQLAHQLHTTRANRPLARENDWVFPTKAGTAHQQRNVARRGLRAAVAHTGSTTATGRHCGFTTCATRSPATSSSTLDSTSHRSVACSATRTSPPP